MVNRTTSNTPLLGPGAHPSIYKTGGEASSSVNTTAGEITHLWNDNHLSTQGTTIGDKPTLILDDSTYYGPLVEGMPHGIEGLKSYNNGTSYKGGWNRGERHGQGHYVGLEEEYIGTWVEGRKHGRGKQTNKGEESTFEGTFANDRYEEGTLTFADGSFYKGKWNTNGDFIEGVHVGPVTAGAPTTVWRDGEAVSSGCCTIL